MTSIQDIESVLEKMEALLRLGARDTWADALEVHRFELRAAPSSAVAEILAMYGGMGSLNDLVLYRAGQPLPKENNELDELRSELYELCQRL